MGEEMKNELVEKGDRFLVTNDMPTIGLAVEAAPASGGFKCTVPAGTILVADGDQRQGAPGFYCRPENYNEMEKSLVPEAERQGKYISYVLVCRSAEIGNLLKPLNWCCRREWEHRSFKIENFIHTFVFSVEISLKNQIGVRLAFLRFSSPRDPITRSREKVLPSILNPAGWEFVIW
jgi:hypothetical protein